MKVLEINSVTYGSTGTIVKDLSFELKKRGHKVLFAYGRGKKPKSIKSYKIGTKFSIFMHVILSRIFDLSGFGSKLATKKLLKQIDKFKPDIIHLHNLHGYYINVQILFDYLKKKNVPVIWMLHDCWAFTGHCSHYTYNNCYKWNSCCKYCKFINNYPRSFLIDNSKKNFLKKKEIFTSLDENQMTIVVPSEWLKSQVYFSFLTKYPIIVFKSGVDYNIFKPNTTTLVDCQKKIILGVSMVWNKAKGLNDFIELSKKVDNQKYQIVMIGVTKKQKKKLPNNIIAFEKINSQKELAEWYSKSYVYFNGSKEETQGLTTVEAIMCGTPAIVYNKTAIPETVNNKVGCIINSLDEFIDTLNVLPNISNYDLKEYKREFDKTICVKKYIDYICDNYENRNFREDCNNTFYEYTKNDFNNNSDV